MVFLFLIPLIYADEYTSEKHKWEKCNFNELKTSQAKEIKEKQGRKSLEKYLIKKCGYRPIQQNRGYSFLAYSDCEILYKHARKSECNENEYSEYLSLFILELDPKVFSEQAYQSACRQFNASREDESTKRRIFWKETCPVKRF
jgi:hypothetical protein